MKHKLYMPGALINRAHMHRSGNSYRLGIQLSHYFDKEINHLYKSIEQLTQTYYGSNKGFPPEEYIDLKL